MLFHLQTSYLVPRSRSRSNFSKELVISQRLFHLQTSYLVPMYNPKWVKNQRTGHISQAISPTDFILGTKVQPNKAHSMTQVPMTLTEGQGQRSRSNFPQNGPKTKELVISRRLFNLQTSYMVPRYNSIRRSQWP